ncbi:hypothetical protein [Halotia branconii]|uniref:Uncharacterized protein n=1 Tax=Halotia branconii CENA392 TaxID=1539056 RepID=A0AAJ6PBB6_9CYAN|nr:hypothetical protein [Halotia branconii]WGV27627.1 hypothetical protein QI031_09140 [Halotia branconii CENA392]
MLSTSLVVFTSTVATEYLSSIESDRDRSSTRLLPIDFLEPYCIKPAIVKRWQFILGITITS